MYYRFAVLANSRSLCDVVRLYVVCLSVTLVHSTQPVEIFRIVSPPFDALVKILRRSSKGNPSIRGGLNARGAGVAKYGDFGPIEGCISDMVRDRR